MVDLKHSSDSASHDFADSDVIALDNIRLELPYAGAGSRVLAGIIDYTFFYGVAFVLAVATMVVFVFLSGTGLPDGFGGWAVALGIMAYFLLESFWFAVQEMVYGGQTLGKRAIGLRTVAAQGHQASSVSLLLRNLVKTIDIVVGAWFLVFDKRSRRIGDRLAGTVVVYELEASGQGALKRVPQGWGSEKVRVAEELLERLFVLDDARARALSENLLRQVAADDPTFLEAVPAGLAPTTRLAVAFGAHPSTTMPLPTAGFSAEESTP